MTVATIPKYWKSAIMSAAGYTGDNRLFLLGYLLELARVVVLLSVWRTVYVGRDVVGGMTLEAVLTYTVISSAFGGLLAFHTALNGELMLGAPAMRFLRPMNIFGQYIAEAFGTFAVQFGLFSLPLLLLALFLGVALAPASVEHAFWFIISLGLTVTVGSALEVVFGALAVALGQGEYSVTRVRLALIILFSGQVIPLSLLPWGIGRVLGYLPFASMASAPLRIYTGTGDPAFLVLLQVAWALVLWPLALLAWNRQRERLVTYGG